MAEVLVGQAGDIVAIDPKDRTETWRALDELIACAGAGRLVASRHAAPFLERRFGLEPIAPAGGSGELSYEVQGPERSGLEPGGRALTPFIGRERELAILHDCLARARQARGQIVALMGEQGVGKSRLLHEFKRTTGSVAWLESRCVSYGTAIPYAPVLALLHAALAVEDGGTPAEIRESLRRRVRDLHPALDWTLPFLGDVLGVAAEDDALRELEAKVKRQRTFEALPALMVAASERRPHVVVIEDLQWIDRTSEDFLAFLGESFAGMPLVLLTTHRPGYTVRWGDKSYFTGITLDVLSAAQTERMVAAMLGTGQAPPDLIAAICETAEGNPLFIEEITSSLLERGVVVRDGARLRATAGASVELPATVQEMIAARIARLDEPARRTLETAAVIGRDFELGLLSRVAGEAASVEPSLRTLRNSESVRTRPSSDAR